MAESNREEVVTLVMDGEEAGFLFDLLQGHVAGKLTLSREPLGRIREALENVGIKRRYAKHSPEYGVNGYAVIERYAFPDDEERARRRNENF